MRTAACTAEGRDAAANCSSWPTSTSAARACASAPAAGEGAAADKAAAAAGASGAAEKAQSLDLAGHRSDVRAVALASDDSLALSASNNCVKVRLRWAACVLEHVEHFKSESVDLADV